MNRFHELAVTVKTFASPTLLTLALVPLDLMVLKLTLAYVRACNPVSRFYILRPIVFRPLPFRLSISKNHHAATMKRVSTLPTQEAVDLAPVLRVQMLSLEICRRAHVARDAARDRQQLSDTALVSAMVCDLAAPRSRTLTPCPLPHLP